MIGCRYFRRSILFPFMLGLLAMVACVSILFPYVWVDVGYITRPIWDKQSEKFDEVLVHYFADGMTMQDRCEAHGWKVYNSSLFTSQNQVQTPRLGRAPTLYDAVIFSVELDMLEIRIRETWDVVDYFMILESNSTFTGLAKETVFANNRKRFEFAESKIRYRMLPLSPLEKGQSAWVNEGRMRDGMTDFLLESGIRDGDLVTTADVDEVISKRTLELLKYCEGTPETIHLQLKNYLYSFEFPVQNNGIWETGVIKWKRGTSRYLHSQISNILLSDAGWHCSFCFRTIKDFQFKMQAYSHADRVRYTSLMKAHHIQRTICEGRDLFGMFPEAYSFKDLVTQLGTIPKSSSAVGLPLWVLTNRERFRFLLPGGCQRQDALLS
ncbi:beta-1,4-mannosyl-glycoprotein beta-1,4-N-acetylglucosaminyltransferase [Entomortierella parvispora]|uniref:Beta-1,4-mannosyl-glycoprotein beta-1,4-N-acetylglucosaminyltransferase n=1 Tax=Entomortierella parvispora TaxID=205924 RepID=A0A9P3HJW2_9FUNG|nr:beta-1,4-mannosyl-glycoprotein beta-1,4-N-acetylglucosaminyltransferase [Entomortierella parvispora]